MLQDTSLHASKLATTHLGAKSLEIEAPKDGYTWYVGEERSWILPITYLIWCPTDVCVP